MARRKSSSPNFFTLGALWWFVIGGAMGLLHLIFPGLIETPLVVVLAVLAAIGGTFAIVYYAKK